jgi:hypothetical protein
MALTEIRGGAARKAARQSTSFGLFQDPTRILNGDKRSFHFCPKTGQVLKCKAEKSLRNSQEALQKRP